MLWAKSNFLFQGLEHTGLFLLLPSAPAPVPGSLYHSCLAKGFAKTKPTWPIRFPLRTYRLTFQGLCTESKRSSGFCQNPNYLKNGCCRARLSPLFPLPLAYGPDPRAAALPGTAKTGHMRRGRRSMLGPVPMGRLGTGHEDCAMDTGCRVSARV